MGDKPASVGIGRMTATLVGAAVGNALGWPYDPSSGTTWRVQRSPTGRFESWNRRVGSGDSRYLEPIAAGEFNGTINLTLAVARSLDATDWYEYLTRTEIPSISDALRGIPTNDSAALDSWVTGVPPWQSKGETAAIYGTNRSGSAAIHPIPVTLRSLLHGDGIQTSLRDVSRVVGVTHGHPSAYVAAVTVAGSLDWLLHLDRTLEYGELLAVVVGNLESWLDGPREGFLDAQSDRGVDTAAKEWDSATHRMLEITTAAAEQLEATAFERIDLLGDLSTADPGVLETVAGAIYVFSANAANPSGALVEAMRSITNDVTNGTSIVGAMLGAVGGRDTLGRLASDVQDSIYITALASTGDSLPPTHSTVGLQEFRATFQNVTASEFSASLPDSRPIKVVDTVSLKGTARDRMAIRRKVSAGNSPGETLYFAAIGDQPAPQPVSLTNPNIVVGLPVTDIKATRRFYENIGLKAVTATATKLEMTNGMVFFKRTQQGAGSLHVDPVQIVIYVDESDILGMAELKHQDPDGRIIHFRSRTPKKPNRAQNPVTPATPRKPKMAQRPLFIPEPSAPGYPVSKKDVDFEFFAGFSVSQKQKSIRSFHQAAADLGHGPILEVSTKSLTHDGVRLSAFNLTLEIDDRGPLPLEVIFQGGKVFEHGGPFKDLYSKRPKDAKKDPRLTESGQLIAFEFSGETWPLEPKTAFYDYLYLLALSHRPNLAERLLTYRAFTDIEFNPKKSINCQARSAALYVALENRGVLPDALRGQAAFLDAIGEGNGHEPEQLALTP